MKTKPISPYQRLVNEARQWVFDVKHPTRKVMFTYTDAAKQSASYRLDDLYQRVLAADQLGYDCVLTADKDGLCVQYVKRPKPAPWAINPDN